MAYMVGEAEVLRRELQLLHRERERERSEPEEQISDLEGRLDELFRQVLAIAREEQV